jgi:hypothetical protein
MRRQTALLLLVGGLCGAGGIAAAEPPPEVYTTLLPGYSLAHAHDVVVDGQGNAVVIAAADADGVYLDVLVVKLDPAGSELWHRYVQGSRHDYATGLALDSSGDVWVTGWTDSPDFPVVNAMDETLTGPRDVFLMKLASSDGSILTSTFIGGDYADAGLGIAIDASDEIVLAGIAGSTDFPTTPDAYQGHPSFPRYYYQDAFVARISPDGGHILYSTYFGGTEDDEADRVALDAAGNIIIAGRTDSDDFPLADAFDAAPNDLFVSKLSSDGGSLLFSTYLGGSDVDRLENMTADAQGNVYLTGSTRSTDYPTTPGSYQETFVGSVGGCEVPFGPRFNCEDFFVSKLSTGGAGMVWSTYLGGTVIDEPRGIAVDAGGGVYVVGYTTSTDFPQGGDTDIGAEIVVSRLGDDGASLDYTTSVASGSANRGNGVAVDKEGAVYFTGTVGVPADIYVSKLMGDDPPAITGVEDGASRFPGLVLEQNRPNPLRTQSRIAYVIPGEGTEASSLNLSVFDIRGKLVRVLVNEPQFPGRHTAAWHGEDAMGRPVSPGVYFYRLRLGAQTLARRMVVTR